MALTREQKRKIVEDLKKKIDRQKVMVFVDFKGLKVKDLFDLKRRLKKVDSVLVVAKKTLIRLVFQEKGIEAEIDKLKEQPAIIFGFKDEILPAKVAYQFSQENENLKILGGYFENKFREAQDMITLAKLPSREELLARVVGSISAPISGMVNVLQGNIRGLVWVLGAIK